MTTETLVRRKAALRREILTQRESLAHDLRAGLSRKIVERLTRSPVFENARTVMIYLSRTGEVETDDLMARAFQAGKRVMVPVVDPDHDELKISELASPEIPFRRGSFGIREPREEDLKFVGPEEMDLVVAPGVAFDRQGNRIGYGKGFYDRLLVRLLPGTPVAALAFDFQIRDTIPHGERDRRVDMVFTENGMMNCGG
ncbi:MAG: 5-formyltetrahydrofolate cyclo-ligase [Nitrospinaceae bacterium]|nr:5-formyltetrahydrofolate cyclo-ligase [Nitrospinaceae bacterium]NIR56561.1 5-formyltetrahydrofolate cyclo-ligase [Nitrospinaceae bacterium]NIS87023.1 5-formyltetrahydrofolate cyclo-ligase [Nitrospinaceae bacterium]NIT83865.1 5-formyltetrahydrofolate cyclo-ligase [Nitrospinaceae bacterium]NIU46070.1 5-formyltetrahydrofolate cyclo-ligase [Nitrospinaceae bacterium]